ncbi:MAG TPA: archaemetzincin [Thermoanaerobaculia bacterium]|nr:archaemetzincin [Thermoanaerobaculia bacterium]
MRSLVVSILALSVVTACSRPSPPPRGAFEAGGDFEPIPKMPYDWLAVRPEPGQTFEQFVRAKPNRPDARRHKIYLQPIGEFPPGAGPSFKKLQEFTGAFFQMDVVVRPPLDLSGESITSRKNWPMGHQQLLAGDLLAVLTRQLPADAYAVLGLTMADLYPDESWNYVFGLASTRARVGVYSFARYDPRFYGKERTPDWQKLVLRRSCKVLAHEASHMFGIHHCTFYHCLMNGSNSLEETDMHPLDLCPIDLHKLYHSIGFDVIERYEDLRNFCEGEGFDKEAAWFRRRIEHLSH